jgi:hypothetical protein
MAFLGSNRGGLVAFDPLAGKEMTTLNEVMYLGATTICCDGCLRVVRPVSVV